MGRRRHDVPLHVCRGCGKCNFREKDLETLIRKCVRFPERLREGVYARPEVLEALEEEEAEKGERRAKGRGSKAEA